jgi:peptidoglycan hydrolase-like protein with peptidoglycan-binding domain
MVVRRAIAIAASLVFLVVLAGCETMRPSTSTAATTAASVFEEEAAPPPAVTELQLVMTGSRLLLGPIDGVYGPETTAGVRRCRRTSASPSTASTALRRTRPSRAGDEHRRRDADDARGVRGTTREIDGVYGAETTAAVEQVQEDLEVTVDGRIGPETVAAFEEAVVSGELQPCSAGPTHV